MLAPRAVRRSQVLTLPGDSLETTSLMVGVTGASTAVALVVVGRAFLLSGTGGVLGVAAGWLAGELFSGAFHWATDNYGSRRAVWAAAPSHSPTKRPVP